jgi:cell volume regulation protein A
MHLFLLIAGLFLITAVLASKLSAKMGMPALVLFIIVGMLAGSDGFGGIPFDNFALTKNVGMTLLGFILFAGGLETHWHGIRPILARGLSLATIGVIISCSAVAAFGYYFLKLPLIEALLLGGILASTDAAAIFGSLRGGGLKIKNNLGPLLEVESGTNDPMAVFLTVTFTALATTPGTKPISFIPALLIQMPIGLLVGVLVGKATIRLINWLRLEFDGLYSVITIASCAVVLGVTPLIGGNEFIAVYAAGVTLGSGIFVHKTSLIRFHDGLAWLFQIIVFLALGLLVFPKHLTTMIGPGVLFALFLVFVARPFSVLVALGFAKVDWRSKFFISWAGLKGAFPIILATYPVLAKLERGEYIFNLVFFAVFASVSIQGLLLRSVGRALNIFETDSATSEHEVSSDAKLLELKVLPGSFPVGKRIFELGLPSTAFVVLLRRGATTISPRGQTAVQEGDELVLASRRDDFEELELKLTQTR